MRSHLTYLDMAGEYDELARNSPEPARQAAYVRLAELYRTFGEAPVLASKQQAAPVPSADVA